LEGRTNNPHDLAARLSFYLWDSLPDAELLKAAAAGELKSRDQVANQAKRLLADERAKAKLREFFQQWLKIDQLPDLTKDHQLFPDFTPEMATDLRTSLELFVDETIFSDASDFRQLLLAQELPLNGRLAKYYGADLPANAPFQRVALDGDYRVGVLTHPYLLAQFAYTGTSSPIHRGVFISRSILGRALKTPPIAVAPLAPDLNPDLTTRQRVELQTKADACFVCHRLINPLGFTLEHFDAAGKFRQEEKGKPINASGKYLTRAGDEVQFRGVRELATFLADSEETQGALVQQLFQYLVKQPIRAYGEDRHARLTRLFRERHCHIRDLAAEIAVSAAWPEG
jgi:hypothetical protein